MCPAMRAPKDPVSEHAFPTRISLRLISSHMIYAPHSMDLIPLASTKQEALLANKQSSSRIVSMASLLCTCPLRQAMAATYGIHIFTHVHTACLRSAGSCTLAWMVRGSRCCSSACSLSAHSFTSAHTSNMYSFYWVIMVNHIAK